MTGEPSTLPPDWALQAALDICEHQMSVGMLKRGASSPTAQHKGVLVLAEVIAGNVYEFVDRLVPAPADREAEATAICAERFGAARRPLAPPTGFTLQEALDLCGRQTSRLGAARRPPAREMDLRDQFALGALAANWQSGGFAPTRTPREIAERAYAIADAMLAVRR